MNASISSTELHARLDSSAPPIVIDVRKTPAFRGASDMISGALRRDPTAVEQWARSLPQASTAVVYCVHGHEVSQNTAKALRDAGIPTQFLEGGIEEGWRSSDRLRLGGWAGRSMLHVPQAAWQSTQSRSTGSPCSVHSRQPPSIDTTSV